MSIFSLEPLAFPASGQQDLGRVIFDPKKHNIESFELIIKIQPVSSNTSSPLQPSRCKVFQSLRGNKFELLGPYLFCCRVTIYPSFANKIKWVHSSKMILPKNVCWTVVLPNEVVNGIFPAPKSETICMKTFNPEYIEVEIQRKKCLQGTWPLEDPSGWSSLEGPGRCSSPQAELGLLPR